jgi:hypothetical protein
MTISAPSLPLSFLSQACSGCFSRLHMTPSQSKKGRDDLPEAPYLPPSSLFWLYFTHYINPSQDT